LLVKHEGGSDRLYFDGEQVYFQKNDKNYYYTPKSTEAMTALIALFDRALTDE